MTFYIIDSSWIVLLNYDFTFNSISTTHAMLCDQQRQRPNFLFEFFLLYLVVLNAVNRVNS